MTKGGQVPELTWTVTEGKILDGDILEGALKAEGIGVGVHRIIEDTPFANANYAVTFLPGTLTVAETPKASEIQLPPTGGDSSAGAAWVTLLILCGMGLSLLSTGKRKSNSQ